MPATKPRDAISTAAISAAEAAAYLEKYAMYSPERAKQRVRFIDQYRSYVINYNLGQGHGPALRRIAQRRRRPRSDGRSSRSSCRHPGCPRAYSDRQRQRWRGPGLMASRSGRVLVAAAMLCLAGYVFVYATGRANPPVRSDGFSYYVYLPSWFLYGDSSLGAVARDCCGGEFDPITAIIRWPDTGRWVNAHPIGVAILQSPFFLIGHGLTKWSNLSPDGFTFYYQHAAGLAGVWWTLAGLFVLSHVLARRFSDSVTAATLAALLLGTGLYHYATYDSSYSHAYSFFLLTAFLFLTDWWHKDRPGPPRRAVLPSILLGLVAGLIVLTRHTNAIFLLVFPLYGVADWSTLRARIAQLAAHWRELAVMVVAGSMVLAPQLAIYYEATGRVFVSSYGSLSFHFMSPQLWGVLFSVQKGLFFWSPLLVAAFCGFIVGDRRKLPFLAATAVVFVIDTYLIASWWDWQFGASYGHRGFIDVLPLLAFGLAAFFEWSAAGATRRAVVTVLTTALVALSVFQMLQVLERCAADVGPDVGTVSSDLPSL